MRILILTNVIYNEPPDYASVSREAKELYSRKWGIDFTQSHDNPHSESHPVWGKPMLVANALCSYDWVVWMDADAMPTNLEFDLEKYLSGVKEPLVMAKDINGYNAGVFAVARRARDWMLKIAERRNLRVYQRRFREQQAMEDSIWAGEIRCHVPPLEIGWNDYIPSLYNRTLDRNVYERGRSWVLHLPAANDGRRLEIMSDELEAMQI